MGISLSVDSCERLGMRYLGFEKSLRYAILKSVPNHHKNGVIRVKKIKS